jgi:RNA polymerase sigma-70 factor (ECF subfamily)
MEYSQAIPGASLGGQSSASSSSDKALVQLIAAGDRDAMRLLFARHNLRIYRFLRRIVGDKSTAEDLVSEVFLEVWRSAGGFEGRSQVTTWILGIARYKALSALRRHQPDLLGDDLDESIKDPGDDPERIMQSVERSTILQACLKQLSNAHREVLDLVYYHEQSMEEVARITGVPVNTVKTRVFYARKRVAELLAARGVGRECL